MVRRSKLKVRPAIRRSQPVSQDLINSATNVPEECIVPCNDSISEFSPANTSPVQKGNAADVSCSQNEKLDNIQNNVSPSENSVSNACNDGAPSNKPASTSRRRKLVACPTMGKKRKTGTNEPSVVKKTQEAKEPIAILNTVQKRINDTNTIILPHIETIQMPVMNTFPSTAVTESEESAKDFVTLTPVTASTFEQDTSEDVAFQDTIPQAADVPVNKVVANTNISNSEPLPNSTTSTKQLIFPNSNVSSYNAKISDMLPTKVSQLNDNVIEKKVVDYISKPKFISQKHPTKIDVHRRNAREKLKQLRENPDDADEWPALDQNVVSMSDLIYLNPPNKIGLILGMNADRKKAEEEIIAKKNEQAVTSQATEPVPDSSQTEEKDDAPLPVPQIRIADDGSVVIDEESVVLDMQKPVDPKMTTVFEFGKEGMINQCSFLRRPIPRPSRWSDEETNKFYKCLCVVGAEFSLMGAMFRARSVDDLRRKFKRERKKNPNRIDKALMHQHLSKWTDDMFEPKEPQNKSIDMERNSKNIEGTVT